MTSDVPESHRRTMQFENGTAIGHGHRWANGQYCSIISAAGIVGCGIYDLDTANEFGQAIAIAKGTPDHPLREPEDLLTAKIVGVTNLAAKYGVTIGMTGLEAVETLLAHQQAN